MSISIRPFEPTLPSGTNCEFRPLVIPEPEDETILMFFDLKGITRKHL